MFFLRVCLFRNTHSFLSIETAQGFTEKIWFYGIESKSKLLPFKDFVRSEAVGRLLKRLGWLWTRESPAP